MMKQGQSQSEKQAKSGVLLDLLLAILLLAVGLGVRWPYVRAVVFPPLDDPAFYLTTGKNLAAGRGLEVDALWSYQVPFDSVTHPSHEHWMPLTTGLIAGALALQRVLSPAAEPSLLIGQMPGLILGALLVLLTYIVGRKSLPGGRRNRWVAFAAALLVAVSATLSYQSASADSSSPFALLAAWALATAVRPPGEKGSYLGTGILVALAFLTRSDGLLLALAIPLAWWLLPIPSVLRLRPTDLPDNPAARLVWELWERERGVGVAEEEVHISGPGLSALVDLFVAFSLVVAPWLVRNYLAFGTPLPGSVLNQAWLNDYVQTFNFLDHPTWQSLLDQSWQAIVTQRLQALLHNGSVFLLITFPWGLLALPGLWLLRHEWPFFPPFVYGLFLFFVSALVFPVAATSGTFYHSLGAVVPFLALAAMYAIHRAVQRLSRGSKVAGPLFAILAAGLLVLAGGQVVQALPRVAERHQAEKDQFEAIAAWLAGHAAPGDVVMTTQPYTLHYASGYPCIALPAGEGPEAAWKAANRYGARFLIITQSFGQYPQVLHDRPDTRFRLLQADDHAEIYEIDLGAAPSSG